MDAKIEQHCFHCSCGKTCGEAPEFEKIYELRDAGLIIYKTGTDTGMVIILHNIKNVEIPSREIQKSLDLCTNSCPRCIAIFERAKRLVENISVLDKKKTMGICKNCGVKKQTYLSHCKCEETVEKFLRSAAKDNDYNIKPKIKMWLDKSKRFLQSSKPEEGKTHFIQNFNSGQDQMDQGPQRQKTIASKSLSSFQASDENFFKTLPHIEENKDKKRFQIIFPKEKDTKAKIATHISSSTLIKDMNEQSKIRDSEKKAQLEEQDNKTKVTRIKDKPSHDMKDKEVLDKIRDSAKKIQLGGHDKKAEVTSISGKPSLEMKDKEVQDKIRDSDKKALSEGQDKKTKVTSIEDKPSHVMKDKKVQDKIRDSAKKTQLGGHDKKAEVTSISGKPSHVIKDKELQGKIGNGEKKAQIEGQDTKKKRASIIDKPSHEMKDKEIQDKVKDSDKKAQLQGQGKKTKVTSITDKPLHGLKDKKRGVDKKLQLAALDKIKKTSITDKPSHEMKDKEVQEKITDSEKKTELEGQGKKTKETSITEFTDKPSRGIKDKEVQNKIIRDSEKKAQLKRQDKKTKVTSITDKPSHGTKDNDETQLEGTHTKAKVTNITDLPLDETTDRKKRQPKKEQSSEKLGQKELKAESKMGIQKKNKSKTTVKITEREKVTSNLEEPYADNDELKSKVKGKTKENDKKTKPQDLKKSKSLENQTQEKPTEESIQTKSVAKLKSEKSTSKHKNNVKDDVMLNCLIKLRNEEAERLRREKREAHALEKSRLVTEKKIRQILNQQSVHSKCTVFQSHHSLFFEESDESSVVDSENQIINSDIVVGQKIVKDNLLITKSINAMPEHNTKTIDQYPLSSLAAKLENVSAQTQDQDKGIIRYALSNRKFIDMGWTRLPTEKVVRKMNVYRMHPSHPEFDWFAHNKEKGEMLYSSGEKLAEFTEDGHGRWFYRSGKLALDYYNAQELNAQQRYVVYSTGEPDERGRSRPRTILATFDYLGNGVVFDHTGKIRLKYNQSEGVVLDRAIGPVSHWKWHTLNDPPVIQRVMFDTEMIHKDPRILNMIPEAVDDNDEQESSHDDMLSIELNNFVKEKSNKITQTFKPFQIKIKALKINEKFSLRIVDQATVYLLFRDGTTNLKMNIGMTLDHKEILDSIASDIGEVSISLDKHPARSASIAALQSAVEAAQRAERTRVRTEQRRRLRRLDPSAVAVASR